VYVNPQGRFTIPLVGDRMQLETDGTYRHVVFAKQALNIYISPVTSVDIRHNFILKLLLK